MVIPSHKPQHLKTFEYLPDFDANDEWAKLTPLKVFKGANRACAVECTDVMIGNNGEAEKIVQTFEEKEKLEQYLDAGPPEAMTRLMYIGA